MNDDMLSQDEINELLKGVGVDDEDDNDTDTGANDSDLSDDTNVSDYLSSIEQDALGEIGNISFGSAATALSTLLNQKVDITTPQVSVIKRTLLESEFPQPHVAISVEYTEGFEGMNLLVIRTKDASIIADLMMGGDGLNPPDDLGEMQVSAVQEAMNQMMGSASTSMSTIFNKKVDISPPGVDLMDVKNEMGLGSVPQENVLVKISFRLKIGELIDSSIMQLVTVKFAKQLVEELMNPGGGEAEMPVEAPAPVAPAQPEMPSAPQPQQPVQEQQQQQYQQPMQQPPMQQQPMYQQPPMQPNFDQRGQQHLGSQFQQQRQIDVQPAAFSSFETPNLSQNESQNLNMLLDIPLQVTVELGRTKRSIKEILEFSQGSIVELDKLAGEPVDILVNHKLIAKGEVVVIDENFGVRVTDIVSQEDRLNKLR